FNSAFGVDALSMNSTGDSNTAIGDGALANNTNGASKAVIGERALSNNTGFDNSALGHGAGALVSTASMVICIGSGVPGANVSNTTWIGNVYGVTPQNGTTVPVVVSDA